MKATGSSMRNSRRLRSRMSLPEVLLWGHLKGTPAGIRFRRQYAVGSFVADFYCPQAKLVIEVDGAVHEQRTVKDTARDATLERFGVKVLRISAAEILKDSSAVADGLVRLCADGPSVSASRCHLPTPSAQGGLDE
jgi:very-short-patch-repair endonuclease